MPRVRDLLDRQLTGSFVGRSEELRLLHETLADEGPVVVYLHGIAGIGKSRLLGAFCQSAREEGATVMWLDCRGIEPTEAGLLTELAIATGGPLGPAEEIAARLGHVGAKVIVALDTYEVFRLMDTWLRQVFLPKLPDNVRFVLCGREPMARPIQKYPGGIARAAGCGGAALPSGRADSRCKVPGRNLSRPPSRPDSGGLHAPNRGAHCIEGGCGTTGG